MSTVLIEPIKTEHLDECLLSGDARDRLGGSLSRWFKADIQRKIGGEQASCEFIDIAHFQVPGCRIEFILLSQVCGLLEVHWFQQFQHKAVSNLAIIAAAGLAGKVANLNL